MPTNSSVFQNITEPYDMTYDLDTRDDFRLIFIETCKYLIEEVKAEHLITIFALIHEYCIDYLMSSLLELYKENNTTLELSQDFLTSLPPNIPIASVEQKDTFIKDAIEESCTRNTQSLLNGMTPSSRPNPTIAKASQAIGTERLERECHAQLLLFLATISSNSTLIDEANSNHPLPLQHPKDASTHDLRRSLPKTNHHFIFSNRNELKTFKIILNNTALLMAGALWHAKLDMINPLLKNTFLSTVLTPMMALYKKNNTVPTRSDLELKMLPASIPLTRKKQRIDFLKNGVEEPCFRQTTELTVSHQGSIASPRLQKASLKVSQDTLKRECIYQSLLLLDDLFTHFYVPPPGTKPPSPFQATQIIKRLLNATQRIGGFKFTAFKDSNFIETEFCHPSQEKGQLISFYVYKKQTQPKLWFLHKRIDVEALINFIKKTTNNGKKLNTNEQNDLKRANNYLKLSPFLDQLIPCTKSHLKINQPTTTPCSTTKILQGRATLPTFFTLENKNTSAPALPPYQTGLNQP